MARAQAGSMQRLSLATSGAEPSSPRASPGSMVSRSLGLALSASPLWQPKITPPASGQVGPEATCLFLPQAVWPPASTLQIYIESDAHSFPFRASTGLASKLTDLGSGSPGHKVEGFFSNCECSPGGPYRDRPQCTPAEPYQTPPWECSWPGPRSLPPGWPQGAGLRHLLVQPWLDRERKHPGRTRFSAQRREGQILSQRG